MNSYGTISSTTGVVNNNKYEKVITNNLNVNGSIVVTITCEWADIGTVTPSLNTLYATGSAYALTTFSQEELPGGLAKVTLTYTAQYDGLPSTTVVEQSSQQEVAIQEHPNFPEWAAEWDDANQRFFSTSSKAGITSYIKGTTTVTLTEYFSSKPSTNMGNIGLLEYPGGDCVGDATNWLIIGSNRQQQGNFWVRVTTFLYSATPWNSDIYSTVGG